MYIDKRMIYVIMGILLLTGVSSMIRTGEIISLLLTLPGLLIAITFHEYAHALAADKLGDSTPRNQNRLNLNPLSHLDPVGSILLLFAGFGWGKPVQINPRNFDKKVSMSAGEAIVSAAGPIMNILLAFIFTIIYALLYKFAYIWLVTTTVGNIVELILQLTVYTNIGLGVFNLLPFPPLDGSKIFINFIPYKVRSWFIEKQQIFYIIFLVIWLTGISSYIISPAIKTISDGIFWIVSKIFSFI